MNDVRACDHRFHGEWRLLKKKKGLAWLRCTQELDVSEFVLSNELVSMALAMVAENPDVNDILSELFTPDGNELYVHPASRYLRCAYTRVIPIVYRQPYGGVYVVPKPCSGDWS